MGSDAGCKINDPRKEYIEEHFKSALQPRGVGSREKAGRYPGTVKTWHTAQAMWLGQEKKESQVPIPKNFKEVLKAERELSVMPPCPCGERKGRTQLEVKRGKRALVP